MAAPKGHKRYGGRKKGTPNKVTADTRVLFKRLFENLAPEVEGWIRDQAHGIEIEKILPDGTSVTGRFNADPGKAADLVLKLAEYHLPKLARSEVTVKNLSDEALLEELRRREGEKPGEVEPAPTVQ